MNKNVLIFEKCVLMWMNVKSSMNNTSIKKDCIFFILKSEGRALFQIRDYFENKLIKFLLFFFFKNKKCSQLLV